MKYLFIALCWITAYTSYAQEIPKKSLSYQLLPAKKEWQTKRVIAIGEQFHGAKTFNEARFEIIGTLLKEPNVDMIFMEAGLEPTIAFNLAKNEDQLIASLKHFYPIYQTTEYLNFFKSLKKDFPNTVLAGFDFQEPLLISPLLAYHLPCFDSTILTTDNQLSVITISQLKQRRKGSINPPLQDFSVFKAKYEALEACALSSLSDTLSPAIKKLLLLSIKNRLDLIKLLEEDKDITHLRDSLMADRVFYLDSVLSPKRFIVTGANQHISKCNVYHPYFSKPMGAYLNEKYLTSYYAFGISGFKGFRFLNYEYETESYYFVETTDEKMLYHFSNTIQENGFGIYTSKLKAPMLLDVYKDKIQNSLDYIYFYKDIKPSTFIEGHKKIPH